MVNPVGLGIALVFGGLGGVLLLFGIGGVIGGVSNVYAGLMTRRVRPSPPGTVDEGYAQIEGTARPLDGETLSG